MEEKDTQLNNINSDFSKPILETELRSAIGNTKLNSAPGIDQIDNRVISSLPDEYLKIILMIYNDILAEGSFPEQWRQWLCSFLSWIRVAIDPFLYCHVC